MIDIEGRILLVLDIAIIRLLSQKASDEDGGFSNLREPCALFYGNGLTLE